ncbi:MAG TPA: HEAT repeat domain-containing protein [Anaerolineae bacterium]|nr:HEAT repeat domain-containing protein [Anaerolineae bacterium]
MRLTGRPNVERLKAQGDLAGLIQALSYQHDERVYQPAIAALVAIGKPAVGPLVEALGDARLRKGATEVLVQIGPMAMEALIAALEHRNEALRKAATEILARIGMLAVDPLAVALRHRNWIVREAATEALVQIGMLAVDTLSALATERREKLEARVAAATALARLNSLHPLLALLPRQDDPVRPEVARLLGASNDARAVEPLIAALKDADPTLRGAAAQALGELGNYRAVEPLAALFRREPEADARTAIAAALQKLGRQVKLTEAANFTTTTPQPPPGTGVLSGPSKQDEWDKVLAKLPALKPLSRDAIIQLRRKNTEVRAFNHPLRVVQELQLEFNDYSRLKEVRYADASIWIVFDNHFVRGDEIVPPTRQLEITVVTDGEKLYAFQTINFVELW